MNLVAYGLLVQGDFADAGSWANVTYIQFANVFIGLMPILMSLVMSGRNKMMAKMGMMMKMVLPLVGVFLWADAADDDGKSNDIYSYFSLGLFVHQFAMCMSMMKKMKGNKGGKGRGKGKGDNMDRDNMDTDIDN